MNILQLIQAFCGERGLEVPATVVGNTDAGVIQLRQLVDKTGRDIRRRTNWQALSRRASWVSINNEDQGAVDTLLTENQEHIIPGTFWDVTTTIEITGPASDIEWQRLKALSSGALLYRYRVAAGRLLVFGPLPAGHTLSLIYKSKNWLLKTAPSTYIEAIDADTNTPVFPDELMLLGLDVFWRQAKEMAYQDQLLKYSGACFDSACVDNVKPVVRMDDYCEAPRPTLPVITQI